MLIRTWCFLLLLSSWILLPGCKLKLGELGGAPRSSVLEVPLGEFRLVKSILIDSNPKTTGLTEKMLFDFEQGTGKVISLSRQQNVAGGFRMQLAGVFAVKDPYGQSTFVDCSTAADTLQFEIYAVENSMGKISNNQSWSVGCTREPNSGVKKSLGHLWPLQTLTVLPNNSLKLDFVEPNPAGKNLNPRVLSETYELIP